MDVQQLCTWPSGFEHSFPNTFMTSFKVGEMIVHVSVNSNSAVMELTLCNSIIQSGDGRNTAEVSNAPYMSPQ